MVSVMFEMSQRKLKLCLAIENFVVAASRSSAFAHWFINEIANRTRRYPSSLIAVYTHNGCVSPHLVWRRWRRVAINCQVVLYVVCADARGMHGGLTMFKYGCSRMDLASRSCV
jgi:hypothetical protein